jgi:hypothetical protein
MKIILIQNLDHNESNEDDYLIYDADDEAITEWFKNNKTKAKLIPFH